MHVQIEKLTYNESPCSTYLPELVMFQLKHYVNPKTVPENAKNSQSACYFCWMQNSMRKVNNRWRVSTIFDRGPLQTNYFIAYFPMSKHDYWKISYLWHVPLVCENYNFLACDSICAGFQWFLGQLIARL